ncbi:hypothetical protein J6590_051154 [Homalodisca vitripennis]|nr:hypothetical protein J6590_051154 [Homalodisca vitripennis]
MGEHSVCRRRRADQHILDASPHKATSGTSFAERCRCYRTQTIGSAPDFAGYLENES